jgi:ribonucleoside-diphosphate reductase beta chain
MLPHDIQKRDGTLVALVPEKITRAIMAAMQAVHHGTQADAEAMTRDVLRALEQEYVGVDVGTLAVSQLPTVEHVQDLVEETLMASDFHDVAKAYILYRAQRAQERKRDIFKKRMSLKPYEYPELAEYIDAIRHSYWIHTEFNFTSDIQDFKVRVTPTEREVMQRTMLAIAQIEIAVKSFWGDIFKHLPKPEIGAVGYTFAESEVRHHDAYAHLLEILGLNSEFAKIRQVPALMERIRYLERSLAMARSEEPREYVQAVLLFSLFIEHVSLFSQFLIMMSFNKHRNLFKGISNAVEATSKEEQIHGLFGIDIINIIRGEHPEWFDKEFQQRIAEACREAFTSESHVVDWIFAEGELDFLPKDVVKEFIKNRLNNSLASIGMERLFPVDAQLLASTEWFDDEIIATKHGDFFVKRSINYNKRSKSITSADLF